MVDFFGCGLENKFLLNQSKNNINNFISLVTSNSQVRSDISKSLEKKIIQFGKSPDAISKVVGSATDGLFFSLLSSNLKPGSKIGVTSYSFHASASSIVRAGFVPVFIDVDKNGLMDLNIFESIAKNLHGVVIVQLFGSTIDEKKFINICSNYKIKFIEDAAQRHIFSKTLINSKFCISSVLSFDPFKIFSGIGTGGAVITKKASVAKKINNLHYHGNKCDIQGYNSQMSESSAWLINKKIDNFNNWQKRRRYVAKEYNNVFSKFDKKLRTLANSSNLDKHSLHKYVVVFNSKVDRDYIEKKLISDGVKTMVHYRYILPELPLFKKFARQSSFKYSSKFSNSIFLSNHSLSLPIHPFIKDYELLKITKILSFHMKNL